MDILFWVLIVIGLLLCVLTAALYIDLHRADGLLIIDDTGEKDIVRIELDDIEQIKKKKRFILKVAINSVPNMNTNSKGDN